MGLGGNKKPGSSIVHKIFQGAVSVTTRQLKKTDALAENDASKDDRGGIDVEDEDRQAIDFDKHKAKEDLEQKSQPKMELTTIDSHFLQLPLDVSEKPLFWDDNGGLVISQEPLVRVLKNLTGCLSQIVSTKLLKHIVVSLEFESGHTCFLGSAQATHTCGHGLGIQAHWPEIIGVFGETIADQTLWIL